MTSLTTRQRDLLQLLLESNSPIAISEVANQLQLTPRQVNYSLKGVRSWLYHRNVELKVTPGVGVEIISLDISKTSIKKELFTQSDFQLVLSIGQRQQLFALKLLTAKEPLILYNLQQIGQVSRTTILKDLEMVGEWVLSFSLNLERRPNYGIWISGTERNIRQAIAALLWGDTPFEDALWHMNHVSGLRFTLAGDAHLLPDLEYVNQFIQSLDTKEMIQLVATTEANLGGRFTDHGVLHLALALAIQKYRLQANFSLSFDHLQADWLGDQHIWRVSQQLLHGLQVNVEEAYLQAETGMIAMLLLSSAKDARWPGDLEVDGRFASLIEAIMQTIGEAYELPELAQDATLRDGLIAYILPACFRKKFRVWTPIPAQTTALTDEKYAFENELAEHLIDKIQAAMGVVLPPRDLNNLAFLLRAAYIRERPNHLQEVIVVCPSGMATAQLLMARLKARFPRLGNLSVVSVRELHPEKLQNTDLIITTVSLSGLETAVPIIQVHPQLLPEDVARITQWLA